MFPISFRCNCPDSETLEVWVKDPDDMNEVMKAIDEMYKTLKKDKASNSKDEASSSKEK